MASKQTREAYLKHARWIVVLGFGAMAAGWGINDFGEVIKSESVQALGSVIFWLGGASALAAGVSIGRIHANKEPF